MHYAFMLNIYLSQNVPHFSIGYAIADRLASDGAKIMISSRKQANVDKAVHALSDQYGTESVTGVVCHVGKDEDRKNLIKEVIKKMLIIHYVTV